MQMFGVGILELMVILILTVIVVGPDRMPQFAADLAKWIRQTRAYARHLMGDFNSVVADLEKEAGTSREDWKEIASVVTRHTGSVGQELTKLGRDVEKSGDLAEAKAEPPAKRCPGGAFEQRSMATATRRPDGESTSVTEVDGAAPRLKRSPGTSRKRRRAGALASKWQSSHKTTTTGRDGKPNHPGAPAGATKAPDDLRRRGGARPALLARSLANPALKWMKTPG